MTDQGSAYFRNLYDHLIRISDMVDAYRDLIGSAMDTHLSMVSSRLNVIMKQLAMIATIFLPLGFLTGLFGQNFALAYRSSAGRLGLLPVPRRRIGTGRDRAARHLQTARLARQRPHGLTWPARSATMPSMAFLIVITGPPGAGKSTVAGLLTDEFEKSVLVEGDAFFAFLGRSAIEPWLPAAHRQNEVVIRAAAAAAGEYVAGGYSTVYDGVVGPWFLAGFAAATALDHLHYAVLLPSVERCVAQVSRRTGHEFTDEAATRHMHQDFAGADIDQRHVLADSSGPAGQTAAEILKRIRNGMLRYP